MNSKIRRAGLWVLAAVIALAFAGSALGKLTGSQMVVEGFEGWGYPIWFMYVVGVGELIGAGLLLFPDRQTAGASLRVWGTAVLAVVMVGALGTHLVHAEYIDVLPPLTLLAGLAVLAKSARSGQPVGA